MKKLVNYFKLIRATYQVKEIDGTHLLYEKNIDPNHPSGGKIVAIEDMFDICSEIHRSVGHQGRVPMLEEAKKFYGNVTRPIVELFLKFSSEYQTKRCKDVNHGYVAKAVRARQFNSRWQIDLIDFRTLPDGIYNWICTVQDHFTKFVWLKPLANKTAIEVARVLFEV